MIDVEAPSVLSAELARARARAAEEGLPYAGVVTPKDAWALFSRGEAALVDVRSLEEQKFVGRVHGAVAIPWATGTGLVRNPRFVREVEQKVRRDQAVLLLCRSGKRSALAARVLADAGFEQVYNIDEGFEGEIDEHDHRGQLGGWRFHGLPWVQD